MNTDKVLALAKQANFTDYTNTDTSFICVSADVIKFAALLQQQMEAEGYRKCAEGQRTSQFCAVAEELRKDAERYQWLRLADNIGPRTMQMQYHHVEHLDAAIDKARKP